MAMLATPETRDSLALRRTLVETQLRPNAVTDAALLAAMLAVPREDYVAQGAQALAYMEGAVSMTADSPRRLMPAMPFARLVQEAGISGGNHVLVVGAGTGYGAAVLARLGAVVTALEDDTALAAATLLGVTRVAGPLAAGWPDAAPYDAIVFEGAIAHLPQAFAAQLAPGGRIVAMQDGTPQRGMIWRRLGDTLTPPRPLFDASAPTLPGFAMTQGFAFRL